MTQLKNIEHFDGKFCASLVDLLVQTRTRANNGAFGNAGRGLNVQGGNRTYGVKIRGLKSRETRATLVFEKNEVGNN